MSGCMPRVMVFFGILRQSSEKRGHQLIVVLANVLMNAARHEIGCVFTNPDIAVDQTQDVGWDALDP